MTNILTFVRRFFLNLWLSTVVFVVLSTLIVHSTIEILALHPNGVHSNEKRTLYKQDVVKYWTSTSARTKRGLDFFGVSNLHDYFVILIIIVN